MPFALLSLLLLAACSPFTAEPERPIWVTQQPACFFLCMNTLGNADSDITGDNGSASQSQTSSQSASGGGVTVTETTQ